MVLASIAASVWLGRALVEPSLVDQRERPCSSARPKRADAPNTAVLRGIVSEHGRPVAGACIEATVLPTGWHWTVVRATSGPNGAFSLTLPLESLDDHPSLALEIDADGKRGRAHIPFALAHRLVAIELGSATQ